MKETYNFEKITFRSFKKNSNIFGILLSVNDLSEMTSKFLTIDVKDKKYETSIG